MNAEFNWWLLIVGLVVGAGLVWLVVLDTRRREGELEATERTREAHWLSAVLAEEGWDVPPVATHRLLDLHRRYLEAPPPDEVAADDVAVASTAPASPDDAAAPVAPAPDSELADDDRVGVERGRIDVGQ